MTSPNWTGRGNDPWSPTRLDRDLDLGIAERAVRKAFWATLSGWLVGVHRAVLSGVRPDPFAVWSQEPAWLRGVDMFITEGIRPQIQRAYTPLLGNGFPFESRPFVTAHLAEVRNRMVGVPGEVFNLVAEEINIGVNLGESIPDLAKRVDTTLSTTETPRWQNRATVTARTETIGALNGGRDDAFKAVVEETGQPMEKMWLSTIDSRTREDHVDADGQRVPVDQPFVVGLESLMYPGDPGGSAENVIQCRCTQLLVRPGEDTDMSNRQFLDF